MLAEHVDGVIGVDTHRDTLAAAAVSPIGAVLETTDAPAHGCGYPPELLKLLGVGPITAAQILVSWSHPGRFRSEAAFASFAGVAPIPASSGLTNKHRLNRGGDRQLNRAMHTITLIRMRLDPATKAYVARRISEGKSARDAQRCLKRNVCRQIFKILERRNQPNAEELPQAA
ncbi:IS110 family transposase [Streptomyces sp. NPDC096012]|uniref:IS110 family transposase n=1 Tax=Streptomyces sp. NPDC096012 TaxID=3155684 RepID=UPI003369C8A6